MERKMMVELSPGAATVASARAAQQAAYMVAWGPPCGITGAAVRRLDHLQNFIKFDMIRIITFL